MTETNERSAIVHQELIGDRREQVLHALARRRAVYRLLCPCEAAGRRIFTNRVQTMRASRRLDVGLSWYEHVAARMLRDRDRDDERLKAVRAAAAFF